MQKKLQRYMKLTCEEVEKLKPFKNAIKGELTIVISENSVKTKKFDEEKIVNKIKNI